MPDPRAVAFAAAYSSLQDFNQRDEFKRRFAETIMARESHTQGLNVLLDGSDLIGEDLTQYAFRVPNINPIPQDQARQVIGEAAQDVPLWRRGIAKAVGAAEWWQNNVTEPATAAVFNTALQFVPGEQGFESRLTEARKRLAAESALEGKESGLRDYIRAAQEAYRGTNTPWGLKGFSELVFDPLNVVGLGIPGRLSKAAPALRPILAPLQAIDQAPNVLSKKALDTTGQLLKRLPVTRELAKPHWTTEVRDSFRRVHQSVTDAFGPTIDSDNPADTAAVFSNLSTFPEDAGPYSVRNVVNHLGSVLTETQWTRFHDELLTKTPKEAAESLASVVAFNERRVLQRGGERLTGEVVRGVSAQRRERMQSIFDRMRLDEKHSKAIAESIDRHIFGWIDNTYLRKIEPMLVRPWALSHLAFAGFGPMNIAEDIAMSVLGMNNLRKWGASDSEFLLMTSGLVDDAAPPVHLFGAEAQGRNFLDVTMGTYRNAATTPVGKIAQGVEQAFIGWSSHVGWSIRRGSWLNTYQKEFDKALREAGVTDLDLSALRDVVDNLPEGMEHLRDEVAAKAWSMVTSGNPDNISRLRDSLSSLRLLQKVQTGIMQEFPELPPDARRAFTRAVLQEGGITPDNANAVRDRMRAQVLEWHKFSPEGIKARLGEFVDALAQRPPRTAAEAAGLLRMLQHAGDTIAALPREIRGHFRERTRQVAPQQRGDLWEESLRVIDEDLGRVRQQYEAALERARPHINRLLAGPDIAKTSAQGELVRRSMNEIFTAYAEISRNLDETWQTFRSRTRELFDSTAPADRDQGFWLEYERIGDEIWTAEKDFRNFRANTARTGWNALFEVVPRDLNRANRDFIKSGLESALGDADARLNDLRTSLALLEADIATAPDTLQPVMSQRIERLREMIIVAASHRKDLSGKLERFGRTRRPTLPPELRDYEKAARVLRSEIRQAEEAGLADQAIDLRQQLQDTLAERETVFAGLIPDFLRPQWDRLQAERTRLQGLVQTPGLRAPRRTKRQLRAVERDIMRFRRAVEQGDVLDQVSERNSLTVGVLREAAAAVAGDLGGVPQTIEDALETVTRMAAEGNPAAQAFGDAIEAIEAEAPDPGAAGLAVREIAERLFARTVEMAEQPPLSPIQLQRLRQSVTEEMFPDRALVGLVESGYVSAPTRLRDGKWRVELTDLGRDALSRSESQVVDTSELLDDVPDAVREFETAIDGQMSAVDQAVQRALDVNERPPLSAADEGRVGSYLDSVAAEMRRDPNRLEQFRRARQEAGRRANSLYNDFFINYDNRNTLDFIMQRFMPFWMYESRRWPRLIRLAGARPVLAKQYVMLGGEWDYGYTPTPFGFEFNPAKGTIVSGLRRTVSRDFPELHTGYRGRIEEGLDWLGRGGFYFAPPITAANSILQGEVGGIAPPPISLILHGLAGGGVNLPEPLKDVAFDSRYSDFLTDQVLADRLGKSPAEIRRLVEAGDDDAMASFNLAQREAALRMIALSQLSVFRYRPASKREFIENSQQAISEYIGLSPEDQKGLRSLGISPYEVVPVSGFQRRQMREAVPNYDAWVNASVSLRPIEEQRMIRRIDSFWAEMERAQTRFESEVSQLSEDWAQGNIDGPQARRDYQVIQRVRAEMMESLRTRPEFQSVPITMEERHEYAKRFNKPPQLVHPVDELLETYYRITPDAFTDAITGEPEWGEFFQAREDLLNSAPDAIASVARDMLNQKNTPLERMLRAATPKLRQYYGLRTEVFTALESLDPQLGMAYNSYAQMRNLAARTADEPTRQRLLSQARTLSAQNPIVSRAEAFVRTTRQRMREQDPEMEAVFRLFISRPSGFPQPRRIRVTGLP